MNFGEWGYIALPKSSPNNDVNWEIAGIEKPS
jgi:hypothetical protein